MFGQTSIDSTELQKFWSESVTPIIDKNLDKLENTVQFPLIGDWGYMMGLKKADSLWTRQDFFDNYDKLFDDKIMKLLKEQNYKDAEVFKHDNLTEILVSVGWKNEDGITESGIIFRFKKFENTWKLYVIQGVG